LEKPSEGELMAALDALRAELRGLTERIAQLESREGGARTLSSSPPAEVLQARPAARPDAPEDDLIVIAAAVAAFLGVRAHVRQVRLIQSPAWSQVGRAIVHASHRTH
jgi:methylmalonyl-CoA carboxyltransferase large subunit